MNKARQSAVNELTTSEYSRIAVAAHRWPTPCFDIELAPFVRLQSVDLKSASNRIRSARLAPVAASSAIRAFFPALGPDHALAQNQHFGFVFQEPQASSGIAHFCQDLRDSAARDERCRATARALMGSYDPEHGSSISLDSGHSFSAVAEQYLDSNAGRIDLLITWLSENDEPCCLVVEMKFGHVVTRGQLEAYGQYGLGYAKRRPENLALVLLTPEGYSRRVDRRRLKQEWQPLSWINFLRLWERELQAAGERSPNFALFRYQLWNVKDI